MKAFEYQNALGSGVVPPETRQADVQAIRLWIKAHQYLEANRLDYAIANLLDILGLAGKHGPYLQAAERLKAMEKEKPAEFAKALEKSLEWRANEAAVSRVVNAVLQVALRPSPMARMDNRWQTIPDLVAEEVRRVLATTKEDAARSDQSGNTLRRPGVVPQAPPAP